MHTASSARCPLGPASTPVRACWDTSQGGLARPGERWPCSCPVSGCRARKGRERGSPGPGATVGIQYPSIFVLLERQAANRTHDVFSRGLGYFGVSLGGMGRRVGWV